MTPKLKRIAFALSVTALLVGGGFWLFDRNNAYSSEIPADALLVDVRTPGEFRAGHAKGAVNVPLSQLSRRVGELGPKHRPIAVYCRTGSRSSHAKRWLEGQGFARVIDVGTLRNARRLRRTKATASPPVEASQ